MTLEQILGDGRTFGDEIELTIGSEKVSLGDLRNLSKSRQKELSDKIAGADSREKEARDTAMKAATLLSQLEDARTKLEASKKDPVTDDEFQTGEWWKPVRDQLSARDKKIDDAISQIANLTKAVTQTATIWAEDRWQAQFERNAPRLKKVEAYKDFDYKKVRDYANEHKILDDHGLPSVERAIMELTKANDLETVRKEAYEEGLKKGKTQARLDTMPRPSSATGGKPAKGKSMVEEMGLEGLGDDVMADDEVMAQLEKLGDINQVM